MAISARLFFLISLPAAANWATWPMLRGLGSLTAGVGIDLGIEDEDVDVRAGSQDMVHAAEADIVSPAVAAEDPDGLLVQVFLLGQDVLDILAALAGFEIRRSGPSVAAWLASPSSMVSR